MLPSRDGYTTCHGIIALLVYWNCIQKSTTFRLYEDRNLYLLLRYISGYMIQYAV